jgi:hypothetical protein
MSSLLPLKKKYPDLAQVKMLETKGLQLVRTTYTYRTAERSLFSSKTKYITDNRFDAFISLIAVNLI